MYRFWDGQQWTSRLSNTPGAAAPGPSTAGAGGQNRGPTGSGQVPGTPRSSGGARGLWWIGLGIVALVAVIALIAVLINNLGGGPRGNPADPPTQSRPKDVGCPEATVGQESAPPVQGGRVVSGKLSYPALSAPFRAPAWDTRVPFGRDVRVQNAPVEESSDGAIRWVASAMIARLTAGDGFYDPERGAERVAECVVSKFYGDTRIGEEERANKAIKVDGQDAWLIESHLTFEVPGIKTRGETMIIVVIDTGNTESGLFYGTIPDTSPELEKPIRDALTTLRVER